MNAMVFWATTPQELRALAETGTAIVSGNVFAATPQLRREFGYAEGEDEPADYAAQLFASLSRLGTGEDRLVFAVETTDLPVGADTDADYGRLAETRLEWRRGRALFRDAPDHLAEFRSYAKSSLHGKGLREIWEDERIRAKLLEHDLLWFAPSELGDALSGLQDGLGKQAHSGKED